MSEHGAIQEDIPEYVAGRLEGPPLGTLETHLRTCGACSDMVTTWREIVAAVPDGGESLFEPHPDVGALRKYARGDVAGDDRALVQHLASCPACELEVTAWKVRDAGSRPEAGEIESPTAPRPGARRAVTAVSLIAGIILGVGITVVVRPKPTPEVRIVRQPSTPSPLPPLSGPLPLNVLASPLRGSEDAPSIRVAGDQRTVLIAIQPALPARADNTDRFQIVIRASGGEDVWSSEITAGQVRSHLSAAGVVTLAVPAGVLLSGLHEISVLPEGEGPDRALLVIPFLIEPFEIER